MIDRTLRGAGVADIESGGRPNILLVGGAGQLGWELRRSLVRAGSLSVTTRDGTDDTLALDLNEPGACAACVRCTAPQVIVNAAAYTAVDRAESEVQAARRVNVLAAAELARAAKRAGALLIHYSTDYVFNGRAGRPYRESDAPDPINAYGASKLEGEIAIKDSGARALVLRTSGIYAARGRNFLLAILARAARGERLRVVDDQIVAPTAANALADFTARMLEETRRHDAGWLSEREGVYHATAEGCTSWYGFAREILSLRGYQVAIDPIASSEYPTPAPRPRYSVLDSALVQRRFGLRLGTWRDQLAGVMHSIRPRVRPVPEAHGNG